MPVLPMKLAVLCLLVAACAHPPAPVPPVAPEPTLAWDVYGPILDPSNFIVPGDNFDEAQLQIVPVGFNADRVPFGYYMLSGMRLHNEPTACGGESLALACPFFP